jgi:hypothetical protein
MGGNMSDWTRYNAALLDGRPIPWPRHPLVTHVPPPEDVRMDWRGEEARSADPAWPPPSPWRAVYEPADPSPWRLAHEALERVSARIVSLVALRAALSRSPSQEAVATQQQGIDASIDDEIENWCGTVPSPHWPHPWTLALASELALATNQISDPEVQTTLAGIATRILERSA